MTDTVSSFVSQDGVSPIESVIEDARRGKLFILVDDQKRENEGDLCVIGEYANAEAVNFMAKYKRRKRMRLKKKSVRPRKFCHAPLMTSSFKRSGKESINTIKSNLDTDKTFTKSQDISVIMFTA